MILGKALCDLLFLVVVHHVLATTPSNKRKHTVTYCTDGGPPCKNGRCQGSQCVCHPNFSGRSCNVSASTTSSAVLFGSPTTKAYIPGPDTTDPCISKPCLNGGSCLRTRHGYRCFCEEGYDLKHRCHLCPVGTFGYNCENSCGKCMKDRCHNVLGCTECEEGWYSDLPPPPSHVRHGTNITARVNERRITMCNKVKCDQGGFQTCKPFPCIGDKCVCSVGWTGRMCEIYIGIKGFSSCSVGMHDYQIRNCKRSGGTCVLRKFRPFCFCPPSLHDNARKMKCIEECVEPDTCVYGKCVQLMASGTTVCICSPGYRGLECTKPCQDGKWGEKCKHSCGNCLQYPCATTDGSCSNAGCIPGFEGQQCHLPSKDTTDAVRILFQIIYARVQTVYDEPYTPDLNDPRSAAAQGLRQHQSRVSQAACRDMGTSCTLVNLNLGPGSIVADVLLAFSAANTSVQSVKKSLRPVMRKAAEDIAPPSGYSMDTRNIRLLQVTAPPAPSSDTGNTIEMGESRTRGIVAITAVAATIVLVALIALMARFYWNVRPGQEDENRPAARRSRSSEPRNHSTI